MVESEKNVDGVINDVMRMRLKLLIEGFDSFRKEFKTSLHIKDFSGHISAHPILSEITVTYLNHENEFCSYVKKFPEAMMKCVTTSNDLMVRRLSSRVDAIGRGTIPRQHRLSYGYYGVCWCGIREYVYPVCHNGIVIGALLAGTFRSDERRLSHSFSRLDAVFGLDQATLRRSYEASIEPIYGSKETFEMRVALLAEYLSMLAEHYIEYPLIAAFSEKGRYNTRRNKIISLAIDYISKNLSSKISVADMAVYCMCSKSTLNHMFSAVMGRTIPEFVSIQRVNRAKYLILNTNLSIEQIGIQCGFMSAAYFSVVFKKLTDVTPSEFRDRVLRQSSDDISGVI
ncbi:MAG: helix-turn-helix domain-containing protein [Clostridiales bacterium]|nr:helix-turn-helix domain-containing protein [Clostridiales bacterium]